ncbi:hypothetical protein [Pedobacter agri]|uniref:hypothetical protein n=1 Tax=Pedobacter agri TaxID=454586 RepID=UPI00292DC4B7|nr:hypothetical protein [Pedobacter agri]
MEKFINSYHYLIKKIYPARVNDGIDMELYKEVEKAHYKLEHASKKDESLFLNYRNTFFFFKKHINNAIKDGFGLIRNQLNDSDKSQLEATIQKLDGSLYDINELEVIVSYSNLIFSSYNLDTPLNDENLRKSSKSA